MGVLTASFSDCNTQAYKEDLLQIPDNGEVQDGHTIRILLDNTALRETGNPLCVP